jgi:hypothetical protein
MSTHNHVLQERRRFLTFASAGSLMAGCGVLPVGQVLGQNAGATEKVDDQTLEKMIRNWPATPQKVTRKMVETHGNPHEATPTRLIWHASGPWKWSILYREEVPHNFPIKHTDVLDQAINYKVPPDKMDELAKFDGALTVRITKGEMAAMCDKEPMNFLAINLAHEIILGKKSVEEARQFQAETVKAFLKGDHHPYTQQFIFEPADGGTGYQDHVAQQ